MDSPVVRYTIIDKFGIWHSVEADSVEFTDGMVQFWVGDDLRAAYTLESIVGFYKEEQ